MNVPPSEWHGREISDPTGTRYGHLEDVFVGERTGAPEYGVVNARGRRVVVPLDRASVREDCVVLPFPPSKVMSAPEVRGDVESVPPEHGASVRAFFDEQTTEPMPPVSPAAETVLSEERLDVTTEARPAERVRLRKQVVTEEVTVTVQVRREELVIEREPIGRDGVAAPEDGAFEEAAETVIVLHAEEPVVGRRVVPVERVKLRKDMVLEQASITEPVRRERAEVEHIPTSEEPAR